MTSLKIDGEFQKIWDDYAKVDPIKRQLSS